MAPTRGGGRMVGEEQDAASAAGPDDRRDRTGTQVTTDRSDRARSDIGVGSTDPMTRFERTVTNHAGGLEGLPASVARASATARSRLQAPTPGEQVVRDVTAGVGGPLVVGFTAWLLTSARHAGIRRLYFLARDGQVLLRVARSLAPRFGWDPADLRYLACSRRAINVPLLWDAGAAAAPWMWPGGADATAADMVDRAGLDGAAADRWLRAAGVDDPDRGLSTATRQALVDTFGQGRFGPEGRSLLSARQQLVSDHLAQEGFLDDVPVATVDSGGHGSQLQALASARDRRGLQLPRGYAFQLLATTYAPLFDDLELAWLDDERRGIRAGDAANLTVLLEAFCAADHGSVRGYRRAADRVEPFLGPAPPTGPDAWDRGMMARTLLTVAQAAAADDGPLDDDTGMRAATLAAIDAFWEGPTREEVMVWRRCPLDASQVDGEQLAVPIPWHRALRHRAGLGWTGSWWHWPEGCVQVSPLTTRLVASRSVARIVGTLVGPLRRALAPLRRR